MGTTYKVVAGIVVAAIIVVIGYHFYQNRQPSSGGLLSQSVVKHGDTWVADFTAQIPAPEQAVFNTIEHVEDNHGNGVRSVKVLSQQGNQKTVEMVLAGPAGRTITTRLAFEYFPDQKRITFHSLGSPIIDTRAQYQLADSGGGTLLTFHEDARMLEQLPVPDGVMKHIIRQIFVQELTSLRTQLHLPAAEQASDNEEP